MNLLDRMNQMPPFLCRLMAREPRCKGRKLSLERIAQLSGLNYETVRKISTKRKWDTVRLSTAIKFAAGCGVDFSNLRRVIYNAKRILNHPDGIRCFTGKHLSKRYVVRLLRG